MFQNNLCFVKASVEQAVYVAKFSYQYSHAGNLGSSTVIR